MSILNTFYIMFKSNADDVIKGNKAIDKSTKETERSLKNTNEEANKLGQSFVKMVDGAVSVASTYAGYSVLKNGISQAYDYNKQLSNTGFILKQNVETLDTFANLANSLGGSKEGALSDITGILKAQQAAGLGNPPIEKVLRDFRNNLKNINPINQPFFLEASGFHDPGLIRAMMEPDDKKFESFVKSHRSTLHPEDISSITDETEAFSRLGKSLTKFFTALNTIIAPFLTKAADAASDALDKISNSKVATVAAAGATTFGLTAAWKGFKAWRGAKVVAEAAAKASAADINLGGAGVAAAEGLTVLGSAAVAGSMYAVYKAREWMLEQKEAAEQRLSGKTLSEVIKNGEPSKLPPDIKSALAADQGSPDNFKKDNEILKLIKTGQASLSAAAQASPAMGGANVKIDKIVINTQATDADGIASSIGSTLKEELYSALSFLGANFDDGKSK